MAAGAGKELECSASETSLKATARVGSSGASSTSFFPQPFLIQNLPRSVPMPSTAPSKSLVRSAPPASYTPNLMEEEPLFKTKTGKEGMSESTSKSCQSVCESARQAVGAPCGNQL